MLPQCISQSLYSAFDGQTNACIAGFNEITSFSLHALATLYSYSVIVWLRWNLLGITLEPKRITPNPHRKSVLGSKFSEISSLSREYWKFNLLTFGDFSRAKEAPRNSSGSGTLERLKGFNGKQNMNVNTTSDWTTFRTIGAQYK